MPDQQHHEEQRRDDSGRTAGSLNVFFTRTREALHLPVIDVTDPHFTVPADPATVRGLHDALVEDERRRRLIPRFIMRLMLRRAARKSRLVRAVFSSDAGYLDSITTYVMK